MVTAMDTAMKLEKRKANRKGKIKSRFISTGRYKNNKDFISINCTYLCYLLEIKRIQNGTLVEDIFFKLILHTV